MKSAIVSLFTPLTRRPHSHSMGFARIFSEQLRAAGVEHDVLYTVVDEGWESYDQVFLYQGLDMNGKLSVNLFGGQTVNNLATLGKLAQYEGPVYPVEYPMIPYHELRKRDWSHVQRDTSKTWATLERQFTATGHLVCSNPCPSAHICLGDSHIPSAWVQGTHIKILSGRTLFGMLAEGLINYLPGHYRSATLYFGNIDVRHHLCRQDQPLTAARTLVNSYLQQVKVLVDTGMKVELVELLPLESEGRKIPTTGFYKGTPFFGDWATRNECRNVINQMIRTYAKRWGYTVYSHPAKFTGPDGRLDQIYMERPRSVHISPAYYRAFAHDR